MKTKDRMSNVKKYFLSEDQFQTPELDEKCPRHQLVKTSSESVPYWSQNLENCVSVHQNFKKNSKNFCTSFKQLDGAHFRGWCLEMRD